VGEERDEAASTVVRRGEQGGERRVGVREGAIRAVAKAGAAGCEATKLTPREVKPPSMSGPVPAAVLPATMELTSSSWLPFTLRKPPPSRAVVRLPAMVQEAKSERWPLAAIGPA
jgi:hypothetical protein